MNHYRNEKYKTKSDIYQSLLEIKRLLKEENTTKLFRPQPRRLKAFKDESFDFLIDDFNCDKRKTKQQRIDGVYRSLLEIKKLLKECNQKQ